MNLQERNLSIEMQGDDVKLLQSELSQLGFKIPSEELQKAFFGPGTRDAVQSFQKQKNLDASGVVDERNAALINAEVTARQAFVVSGEVRQANGSLLVGAIVRAFDKDLRHIQPLGIPPGETRTNAAGYHETRTDGARHYETKTDAAGHYEIQYTAAQFHRAEKGTADLIVRVFNEAGTALVASPIMYNAPKGQTVNLMVGTGLYHGPSEYEQIVTTLTPLLEGVAPADLTADDITFLTNEAGIEEQRLVFFVSSAKHAEQTDLPAEAFYGLAREGFSSDMATLLTSSAESLRSALEKAITDAIIPARLHNSLGAILEQLKQLATQQKLQSPATAGQHALGELLTIALPSAEKQTTLLNLEASHEGPPETFWQQLRSNPNFQEPGLVDKIQLTLQLGLLTQNHVPLIQELQKTYQVTSPRDLVKLDTAWTALVNKQTTNGTIGVPAGTPGATPQEQVQNYVTSITGLLHATYPTGTVAQMVATSTDLKLEGPLRTSVSQFFTNASDLDLLTTNVDQYITQRESVFSGIADGDRQSVVEQVKLLRRVLQVSAEPASMITLLNSGLTSAHAIADIPRATFVGKYGDILGGEQTALIVYNRAQYISSTSAHLYTYLYQALHDVNPPAIGTSIAALSDTLNQAPTLAQLFGSMDLCNCDQCQSVGSPAAYFVDLLHMLEGAGQNQAGLTPFQVLMQRRPDLEYIKLTCENTNTEIPYIDLVNEILESYIVYGTTLPFIAFGASHPVLLPLPNDTSDGATTDDLGANPENTNDKAYELLQAAYYPMTLPYDQPVEVMRTYLDYLGSSRYEVMHTFQKDSLVATQHAIAAEYLQIVAQEYQVLTGKNFDESDVTPAVAMRDLYGVADDTLPQLQLNDTGPAVITLQRLLNIIGANPPLTVDGTFDQATSDAVKQFQQSQGLTQDGVVGATTLAAIEKLQPDIWRAFLGQVPIFLSHTGLSYVELVDLLKTRFVNPSQDALAYLERLNISYADIAAFIKSGFRTPDQQLQEALQQAGLSLPDFVKWLSSHASDVSATIVLDATDSSCDLNVTNIQRLDGGMLNDFTLQKMQRFIRLQRKLGWAIPDLDRTVTALQASAITPTFLQQLTGVKQLLDRLNVPLVPFLSLWAKNIDTQGDDSPYRKLFLSRTVLKIDPVFMPAANGSLLTASGLLLRDHVPALLAAIQVRATDLALIRADAQLDHDDTAPLTLATVSTLYKYTVLARALNLRMKEFITLKTLSGIDPFGSVDQTNHFVTCAGKVQQSNFSVTQLNYLYRALLEPPMDLDPQRERLRLLARSIHDGLAKVAVDTMFVADSTGKLTKIVDDPTGELTRNKLGIIFEKAIVDQAIGMINGRVVYSSLLISMPPVTIPDSLKERVSYDDQQQMVRFVGPMHQDELNTLTDPNLPNTTPEFRDAITTIFQQPRTFIADTFSASLTVTDAIGALLDDVPQSPDILPLTPEGKYNYVLAHLLPYLRDRLSRTLIKQTISDALTLDGTTSELLLETVLQAQGTSAQPAISDLLALSAAGLTPTYYTGPNFTGTGAVEVNATVEVDGKNVTLPAGTGSARWTGLLTVPTNANYTFYVRTNGGVQLWLGDNLQPVISALSNASIGELSSAPLQLKAGQLYDLRLEMQVQATPAIIELRWSSATTPKAIVPAAILYPGSVFDTFVATFTLLYKVSMLVNGFNLSAKEIAYLTTHPTDFSNLNLQQLPLDRLNPAQTDANAVVLFQQWQRLSDFTTLRNSLPQGDVSLIDVFSASTLDIAQSTLAGVSGWDAASLFDLIGMNGFQLVNTDPKNELKNEIWPTRLQACIHLVMQLGVSVKQLFDWATPNPSYSQEQSQAQDIKKTVKASYNEQTWLTIAKPLTDLLRESQKAALIAYLLPRLDLVSSDQLFVQRCLMNLETEVSPDAIDAGPWQWMKRYRVWEANRKVFLYPENWIEPELRDNKTPFFKELESELLQNEVTADTVETAFLHYLEKLDDVAHLEICGMYLQDETEDDEETNILHVFGRTHSTPRVYYYRTLVNSTTWTPWEKVPVDIEGDHLLPYVWNRRLYLFWPIFTQKQEPVSPVPNKDPNTLEQPMDWEITLAWSEYKHGTWSTKEVSATAVVSPNIAYEAHGLFSSEYINYLSLQGYHLFRVDKIQDDLVIHVYRRYNDSVSGVATGEEKNQILQRVPSDPHSFQGYDYLGTFDVTGCHGKVLTNSGVQTESFTSLPMPLDSENSFMDFNALGATNLTIPNGSNTSHPILKHVPSPYSILYAYQFANGALQYPFFYQDAQRVYLVTPEYLSITDVLESPNKLTVNRLFTNRSTTSVSPLDHAIVSSNSVAITNIARNAVNTNAVSDTAIAGLEVAGTRAISPSRDNIGASLSPRGTGAGTNSVLYPASLEYRFETFFHPHVCAFIKELNRKGVAGLLTVKEQQLSNDTLSKPKFQLLTQFQEQYNPTSLVDGSYPREVVDYNNEAYALYNWEVFFHIPLMIAERLSQNQQFEEAQKWFHYIFNPTSGQSNSEPSPQRYWNVLPFKVTPHEQIQDLLQALSYTGNDPDRLKAKQDVEDQITAWQHDPFNPHLIARMRLVAYQKNVVMKYIDNLIAWGDQLFRQDTIEAINEATQLYILAADILGPRPQLIPTRGKVETETYHSLKAKNLDTFSNAMVALENEFPFSSSAAQAVTNYSDQRSGLLGIARTLYFCIPQNDQLLTYWDTIADRLFKIRHCMNIEGVIRQLPLFEPPIDPALLVRAAAMGVDLGSVLNDINAATPYYRFSYMLQKALELCADVKALGANLLSALEKSDAEQLAATRASQETAILTLVKDVKQQQIDDAKASKEALEKTQAVTQARFDFYDNLVNQGLIPNEQDQLSQLAEANSSQKEAVPYEDQAQEAHLIPDFTMGAEGISSPVAIFQFGGSLLSMGLQAQARLKNAEASNSSYQANRSSIIGSQKRRSDDWQLQRNLASKELLQIAKQIDAADIRLQIAQKELSNHLQQIENAQKIEEFLRTKYTNQDLYAWMISEIGAVHNQCYQMAYDLAKRAEKAYRFERGVADSNFIQFGYWDSIKKGLLAGERLYLALKQMERAYLDQNKREYEITKYISLVLFDPMALIALKETGTCIVSLPEALFDMDYPGHYMRRIKSVSLTILCNTGPYTSVNCTLTLLSNKIRASSNAQPTYLEQDEDSRFINTFGAIESIATSTAQNDSGMFEVNFRDERYLPFEGAGVVSTWRIDMPIDCNAFGFETVSDVIIKFNYMARYAGSALSEAAKKAAILPVGSVQRPLPGVPSSFLPQTNLTRLFSAKHEFSNDCYRFLHPEVSATTQVLNLALSMERFPFQYRGKKITITAMTLFLKLKEGKKYSAPLTFDLKHQGISVAPAPPNNTFKLPGVPFKDLPTVSVRSISEIIDQGAWSLETNKGGATPDVIDDIWIVCQYDVK